MFFKNISRGYFLYAKEHIERMKSQEFEFCILHSNIGLHNVCIFKVGLQYHFVASWDRNDFVKLCPMLNRSCAKFTVV